MDRSYWLLGIIFAPFAAAALLWFTRPFIKWVWRVLPDGRVKRLLFWRYS
jgi:hypothetical protein